MRLNWNEIEKQQQKTNLHTLFFSPCDAQINIVQIILHIIIKLASTYSECDLFAKSKFNKCTFVLLLLLPIDRFVVGSLEVNSE